jgi:hypothetical protein
MGMLTPKCQRGRFIWVRWWRDIKCVRCIGRNQLKLIGNYWNCLNLIHLIQHECVGDAPWTRGTIHMRHMIRHECVGDTPWSRGNVYMRSDIYGSSALVTDGIHEAPHIWETIYTARVCWWPLDMTHLTHHGDVCDRYPWSLACVKV